MATYRLTSPEGQAYEITAPDDATQEQVLQYFQQNYKASEPQASDTSIQSGLSKLQASARPDNAESVDPVKTLSNIPNSVGGFVSNIAGAIAHPIDTVTGLGNLAVGAVDNLAQRLESNLPQGLRDAGNAANNWVAEKTGLFGKIGSEGIRGMSGMEAPRAAFSAVGDFYSNRYGSAQGRKQTLETDPIGVMADVSALLGLSAGALKLAGANNAAASAINASNAMNPINLAAKAVSPAVKNIYSYAVGQSTGSGKAAVDQALKGSKGFTDAMKGSLTDEEVLQNSRNAIQGMKDTRSAAYQAELANLKNATQTIPIDDVKIMADGWLKRYGVQNQGGKLDFSRSTLKDIAATEVQSIYDDIASWGAKAEDLTPLGLDTLKRRIQNNFVQNSQSRAMATALSNAVKDKIVQNVPSYAKMTSDYEKSSSVINSIEYALSTKNPTHADTALRKIMTAMRQDTGFRRSMLETLDQQTGANLSEQVAGRVMSNPWTMRGSALLTSGGMGMAALLYNPIMLGLMATASPRFMGEFSRAAGIAARTAGKVPKSAYLAAEREQAINQ